MMEITAHCSSICPIAQMATAKQIELARTFMENVTGLSFLGLTLHHNRVMIHFGEWEDDLRDVLVPRDPIKVAMIVEIASVRRIAANPERGRRRI